MHNHLPVHPATDQHSPSQYTHIPHHSINEGEEPRTTEYTLQKAEEIYSHKIRPFEFMELWPPCTQIQRQPEGGGIQNPPTVGFKNPGRIQRPAVLGLRGLGSVQPGKHRSEKISRVLSAEFRFGGGPTTQGGLWDPPPHLGVPTHS